MSDIIDSNRRSLDSFKVFVRIRPFSDKEIESIKEFYSNLKLNNFQTNILIKNKNFLSVIDPNSFPYTVN